MTAPSVERFEPVHDAHAIEQVSIVFQFEHDLTTDAFESLRAAVGEMESDFSAPVPIRSLRVSLMGASVPVAEVSGFVLQKISSTTRAIENELIVDSSKLTFKVSQYGGWTSTSESALKYLRYVGEFYLAHTRLMGVGLSFLDKFIWHGDTKNAHMKFLFRESSPYITPATYSRDDLWHSHSGAFVHVDNKVRRLVNVNIALGEESRGSTVRRVVNVLTVLVDHYNQPGYQPLQNDVESVCEMAKTSLGELHRLNKDVLEQVLSDSMCKRIGILS